MLDNLDLARFSRLAGKELKETLRDRRTMITLFLMPLILYPILSLVMNKLILSSSLGNKTEPYRVGVATEAERQLLANAILTAREANAIPNIQPLTIHWSNSATATNQSQESPQETPATSLDLNPAEKSDDVKFAFYLAPEDVLARQIKDGIIDLIVKVTEAPPPRGVAFKPLTLDIQFRENDSLSEAAIIELRRLFSSLNELASARNREALNISSAIPVQMDAFPAQVKSKADRTGLAGIIPLILILMTITGAVYPAIDLTAGERERGTLEALIASPISRFQLVTSKYVAVVCVSVLTALVNLLAMAITLKATGIGDMLVGKTGMQLMMILRALPLLVIFAMFFSGLLVALCSFARSFKEAQAYLIPVILLSLGPGVISLMPSVSLTPTMAVLPQLNLILLSRDTINQSPTPIITVFTVILTTTFYTIAALILASKGFGDQVATAGDDFRWSDLLKRPEITKSYPTTAQLLTYLALFFPFYFALTGWLTLLTDLSLENRAIVNTVAAVFLFIVLPWCYCQWLRLKDADTFRLKIGRMPITALFVAILLIPSIWIIAYEILQLTDTLGLKSLGENQIAGFKKVREMFLQIPWWFVIVTMAIIPAIAEEFFFRGFVLSALATRFPATLAVIVSSILFGLFHVFTGGILTLERFLPTAFLGLFLGLLAIRTDSLIPGILVHAGHNGLLFSFPRLDNLFLKLGFDREGEHLPWPWIAGGFATVAVATAILIWVMRPQEAEETSLKLEK